MTRFARLFVCLLAAFLCSFILCPAQQLNTGSIEGIVTDPQRRAVPNAHVDVTALDTNVTNKTATNNVGLYRVENLIPGRYQIHITATGFKPTDVTDVQVTASQTVRSDVSLQIGSAEQTVQVTSSEPLVQTEASNQVTTLNVQTVNNIPLAGRDLQNLVYLVPGVNPESGPPGSTFGFNSQYGSFPDPTHELGSDVSVNGGQAGANAWYLDGNLNLSAINENIVVNPIPDAVSDFQVVTNDFSAEYGRSGGGIFNIVLKPGTNNYHGNLYEYLRNDATDARNPFTSLDATGHYIKNRQLRFNNFGGTFGGPVRLPGYNGRDRTFFFFSSDFTILHLFGNKNFTVPTALMRTGNFSEDPNVATFGIWDPYSTVGPNSSGLFTRTAFGTPVPGNPYGANGCTNVAVEAGPYCKFATSIPANRLDPIAMSFMRAYPMPNYNDPLSQCPLDATGLYKLCNNYRGGVGTSQNPSNFTLKIDHQLTATNHLFGEWLYDPGKYRNYRVPWTGPTFPYYGVGYTSPYPMDFSNNVIALGDTHAFSPSLSNDFRISFTRQYVSTNPSHPYPDSFTSQSAVQQLLAPLHIPTDPFFPVPTFNMSGPASTSFQIGPVGWINMTTWAEALSVLDNVTKIVSQHTLKTGFIWRPEKTAYISGFPTSFAFSGEQVVDPTTGLGASGLAQFELGGVSTSGRNSSTGLMWKPHEIFGYTGAYIQDDWRVTRTFMLDLGLRWDYFTPFRTVEQPLSNFCLSCFNPVTGLPGKIIYSGDPKFPKSGAVGPANNNDWGPRVNFSWSPFSRESTVIRGGYDIFYSNAYAALNSPGQGASNAPGWNQEYDWEGSFYPSQCAPLSGQCVAFPLSDTSSIKSTLTTPPMPSQFPAQQRAPLLGIGLVQIFTPPSHDPMVENWNLEVEHQLPGKMMVSVGYIGTHGTHLMGEPFQQFNSIHTRDILTYKDAINSCGNISSFYSGVSATQLQNLYGPQGLCPTGQLPFTILLRPYPFYGAFTGIQNNTGFEGTTVYNAMDVKVQKQYSNGLNLLAAYTWSKKINNPMTGSESVLIVNPINGVGGLGGRAGALGWAGAYGGSFQNQDNKKVDRAIAADDIANMLNIAGSYELPFGPAKHYLSSDSVASRIFRNWRLNTTFNVEGGVPLTISGPCDQVTCRPILVGNPNFSGSRTRVQQEQQWINPAAFLPAVGGDQSFWLNYNTTDPRAWLFSTSGPRVPWLRGPGFWNVDNSIDREFHFTESRYIQFRWELFNTLNHQNLGLPNTSFCLPPAPTPANPGGTDIVHQAGCAFGQITNVQTDPRSMQFALKFYF